MFVPYRLLVCLYFNVSTLPGAIVCTVASRLSLILSSFDTTVCTVVFMSAGLHSTGLRPELNWTLDTAVCTAVSFFCHSAPSSEFNRCLARQVCTRSCSNSVAVLISIPLFCSLHVTRPYLVTLVFGCVYVGKQLVLRRCSFLSK